jgi:hypothetical protein
MLSSSILCVQGKLQVLTTAFIMLVLQLQGQFNLFTLFYLADPTTAAWVATSLLDRDERKRGDDSGKDNGDLGIEVMEYINAAGMAKKGYKMEY